MVGWTDVAIVSLIAFGSVVLVGILGYIIDKTGEPAVDEPKGTDDRR